MENTQHNTALFNLLAAEVRRRRELELAARKDAEQARAHCQRVAATWAEVRTTLLAEVCAANMMLKLHKFDGQYELSDLPVRDADHIAHCDLVYGSGLLRIRVCAYTGSAELQHFRDGLPTFKAKRFNVSVFTLDRSKLQALLAVVFESSLRPAVN